MKTEFGEILFQTLSFKPVLSKSIALLGIASNFFLKPKGLFLHSFNSL